MIPHLKETIAHIIRSELSAYDVQAAYREDPTINSVLKLKISRCKKLLQEYEAHNRIIFSPKDYKEYTDYIDDTIKSLCEDPGYYVN